MTCQYCNYFLISDEDMGLCRRNPPTPIVIENNFIAIFPTMLNEGWCGEFNKDIKND